MNLLLSSAEYCTISEGLVHRTGDDGLTQEVDPHCFGANMLEKTLKQLRYCNVTLFKLKRIIKHLILIFI